MASVEERLWSKIALPDANGCLLWSAGLSYDGYGRFRVGSTTRFAHRVVYATLVGEIPEGLQLDHLCRVRNCVAPDHLEPVTNQENCRRSTALKTDCPQGHAYDEANTRFSSSGARYCLACKREKTRAWRARNGRLQLGA